MTSAERYDAFQLMRRICDDESALGAALGLFVERPDYGFVWLAYVDDLPVACVTVSLGIDLEAGGLVATLRNLFVTEEVRGEGIGSALLLTLRARLKALEVVRIDVLGTTADVDPFLRKREFSRAGIFFSGR